MMFVKGTLQTDESNIKGILLCNFYFKNLISRTPESTNTIYTVSDGLFDLVTFNRRFMEPHHKLEG